MTERPIFTTHSLWEAVWLRVCRIPLLEIDTSTNSGYARFTFQNESGNAWKCAQQYRNGEDQARTREVMTAYRALRQEIDQASAA